MEWLVLFAILLACFVAVDGHKQQYKELTSQIKKLNEEMLIQMEVVKNEILSEIDNIFNSSVGDEADNDFIEKTIFEIVEREVRHSVNEITTSQCSKSGDEEQRFMTFVEDVQKQMADYKQNMQEVFEDILSVWYDCRAREMEMERLSEQVKNCKCFADTNSTDRVDKTSPPPAPGNSRSRSAFGLVIADENSDRFKLMYLNSKSVRTLDSGRRNVTDIVYNHLDGRLYYTVPDSIWSSYLNGGDETLLRNCTTFCMKLTFDAALSVLQYVEYNTSSREYRMCEISLYDENGEIDCEEISYFPHNIIRLGTFAMNMKDRMIATAGHDGGKVHSYLGYFNMTEMGLNETDRSLPRGGEFYEISIKSLNSISGLYSSPDVKSKAREIITRVPVLPSSLTIDGIGRRVFISYERRDIIDTFDLDTGVISPFTEVDKVWGVGRQTCLVN